MQWTTPGIFESVPASWYYVVVGVVAVAIGVVQLSERPNLDAFPTVGSSGGWLGSWWAGIKYMTNAAEVIREGYEKHKGAPFKIATLYHWVVVVTSREHVEELQRAREDEFSLKQALNDDFNFECLLGSDLYKDIYHVTVMRSQLPRRIGSLYPDLRNEIITAFDEVLNLNDDEWKSIPALTAVQEIVCRASNRSFVGLPLCRDPDYIALNIKYTVDAIMGGLLVGFFPSFLKQRAVELLRPVIEERRKYGNEYGNDWTEKPNDLLSWLMDEAPDATVESLTKRVLAVNTAAIHTSANVFTNTLFNLAANPELARPLREEVQDIVKKGGWSKTSLSMMRKVDSFLKESIRVDGIDALGLTRKAVKDCSFSDGTFIPKGTRINAGLVGLHHDETLYNRPNVFDPFRFADLRKEDGGEEDAKHQFVSTSTEYLAFGHGLHACPGRFFAAAELKTMLAHVVMTYDVKLEKNTSRPQSLRIGNSIGVSPTAKVMFRRRARSRELN